MTDTVGAVDIGGSHVAAAMVVNRALGPVVHVGFQRAPRSTAETVSAISRAMTEAGTASRWIVAVPGPFDYAAGVSLITGLGKLEELYNVNLKAELAKRMPKIGNLDFVNDALAAGLGEWGHGAGGRSDRMLFVGLGTGLGSAFVEGGSIVETGPQVPPGGHLGLTDINGALADDQFSTRGLLVDSGYCDASQLTLDADAGSIPAVEHLERFGGKLENFLLPWCEKFAPDVVVFGGGLSNAYRLFSKGFVHADFAAKCAQAANPDIAALYGISVLGERS